MTPPTTFRKADITRACKAVVAAGQKVRRVICRPTGEVELVLVDDPEKPQDGNEWDEVLSDGKA